MSDEYVFPQDRESQYATLDGPKMIREGGLTKRELFAKDFLANGKAYLPPGNGPLITSIEYQLQGAVWLADALLAELEKSK